jgi:5'-3' exonuclease
MDNVKPTLKSKVDSDYPIVLLDTGYINFYSLYATECWFKIACDEVPEPDNDWMDCDVFLEKYNKMYLARFEKLFTKADFRGLASVTSSKKNLEKKRNQEIHKLERQLEDVNIKPRTVTLQIKKVMSEYNKKLRSFHKIPFSQLIFAMDCPRKDIWRHAFFDQYKANRDEVYRKSKWKGSGIFRHTIRELLPTRVREHNMTMMGEDTLESDDIIALLHRYIRQEYPKKHIIIITNDYDLLQLLDGKTSIINLKGVDLQTKSFGDRRTDLLLKVLSGDPSDNIKSCFPKCGKKTALNFIRNPQKLEEKLNSNPQYRERYNFNMKLIDLENIPMELCNTFYKNNERFFENAGDVSD